jgi:hypothetical protein
VQTSPRWSAVSPPLREILSWLEEGAAVKEAAQPAHAATMELELPALSVDEVRATIERGGGIAAVLERSTHDERAALYIPLGVTAIYDRTATKSASVSTPLLQ